MFLRRTNVGRVVYDRPRNFFKYRDIARILKNEQLDYHGDDPANILFVLFYTNMNLTARLQDDILGMVDFAAGALPGAPRWLDVLLELVHATIDLSRVWIWKYGPTALRARAWSVLQRGVWNLEPKAIPAVPPSSGENPFLIALLSAKSRIDDYLEEAGYGKVR